MAKKSFVLVTHFLKVQIIDIAFSNLRTSFTDRYSRYIREARPFFPFFQVTDFWP
ncbi:hypothetical protein JCM15548_13955 [Geofilum rubicundum JCM 15548]|uniref:Uncharacterized protein n=1 Tax=Geofilum rubicundum JCM 15548 TaxID=1236989 RepID=A0A0E9M2H2_9BACT|nr:hypothetical protein JCM15548_13955 [Geofilum rubicundum JCM 15548]